jgi:hypothetical protein
VFGRVRLFQALIRNMGLLGKSQSTAKTTAVFFSAVSMYTITFCNSIVTHSVTQMVLYPNKTSNFSTRNCNTIQRLYFFTCSDVLSSSLLSVSKTASPVNDMTSSFSPKDKSKLSVRIHDSRRSLSARKLHIRGHRFVSGYKAISLCVQC